MESIIYLRLFVCIWYHCLFFPSWLRIGSQLVESTEQEILSIARASIFQDNYMNTLVYTERMRSICRFLYLNLQLFDNNIYEYESCKVIKQ